MTLAVIKTGGKQYAVKAGDKIKIEKLEGEIGKNITLSNVLLVANNKDIVVGQPEIKGASVEAKVLAQGRARKVIVYKFKPKKRERRKKGHRQSYTQIEITSINA